MKKNNTTMRIRRLSRKLKRLFLLIVIISILTTIYKSIWSSADEAYDGEFYHNYISDNPHLKGILQLREQVKLENTDEFIQKVLKEVVVKEVDLLSSAAYEKYSSMFDKEIALDEEKIGNLGDYMIGYGDIDLKIKFNRTVLNEMVESVKANKINLYLSQMISPSRNLPSTKYLSCSVQSYEENLPPMSVIIVIKDESLSILARTIFSIIKRTPKKYLAEIIIIDEGSELKELESKLERYIVTRMPVGLIRLIRLKKNVGRIRARLIGAHYAVGEVLMFIDSHVEVENNWASPLLQRIKNNRKTAVSPIVGKISPLNFNYQSGSGINSFFIGGFLWNGSFILTKVPKYEEKRKGSFVSPARSPVLMEAAFGIDRKFFWEIGSFDPDMRMKGGENIELSFRVWMCGEGSVEVVPCSNIGHIEKVKNSYEKRDELNYLTYNMMRTAEVWMGSEYKKIFLTKNNIGLQYFHSTLKTDFQSREALKDKLKCKGFKWYLDNVYKEKFKFGLEDNTQIGKMYKVGTLLCFDTLGSEPPFNVGLYNCDSNSRVTQVVYVKNGRTMYMNEGIATSAKVDGKSVISFADLSTDPSRSIDVESDDNWHWDIKKGLLMHNNTKKCATVDVYNQKTIPLVKCDEADLNQVWQFQPLSLNI